MGLDWRIFGLGYISKLHVLIGANPQPDQSGHIPKPKTNPLPLQPRFLKFLSIPTSTILRLTNTSANTICSAEISEMLMPLFLRI